MKSEEAEPKDAVCASHEITVRPATKRTEKVRDADKIGAREKKESARNEETMEKVIVKKDSEVTV